MLLLREQLLSVPLSKIPTVVVRGADLSPECAAEVVRRTDDLLSIRVLHKEFRPSQYGMNLRHALGFPAQRNVATDVSEAAIRQFQNTWGYVNAGRLCNSSALGGGSWCHLSGKIALIESQPRYPRAVEYYDDASQLAEAFPFLNMKIMLWSDRPLMQLPDIEISCPDGELIMRKQGREPDELPDLPWSDDLRAKALRPNIGFLIFGGEVAALSGDDERLFQGNDVDFGSELEDTIFNFARGNLLFTDKSTFGERNSPGLADADIAGWFRKARELKLIDPLH